MKKILKTILMCMVLMIAFAVCTSATDFALTSEIPAEMSVFDAKTTAFSVSGTYDAKTEISLEINNTETGKTVLYQQVTTDENGAFTISGIMSDEVCAGWYTVTLGASNMPDAETYRFEIKNTDEAEVSVTVVGGSANVKVNGENKGTAPSSGIYSKGTVLSYTAVANDENKVFLYWQDVKNNVVLSTEETIEVTVGSNASYKAVYSDKTSEVYVTFKSNNKIVASTLKDYATVPENPYLAGYTFDGWYLGGNKKTENFFDVTENTTYVAYFRLNDTEYTVTISGAKQEGGKYKYNDKVTVNAAGEEGKVFTYWVRDGKIVSYSEEYAFYVSADTEVVANYAETATDEEIVLVMAEPSVVDTNRIAFYAERNVPDEYTVIETGILMNQTEDFDIYSAYIVAKSNSTSAIGQYTARKKDVGEGDTWYAKAYLIYKDGEEIKTLYSDTVSKTL